MRIHLKGFFYLAGLILLPLSRLGATDYTVSVYPNNLIPSQLTITINDAVLFENLDIMTHYLQDHSDTSWGFYLWEEGDRFRVTFQGTGSYRLDDIIGGSSVRITVNDGPPTPTPSISLSSPVIAPTGEVTIVASGLTLNSTATLQASANLVDWHDVSASTVTADSMPLTDNTPQPDMSFYRVVQTP